MNTDAAVLLAELSGGPALDTRGVHTGSIVSGEQWQWACTLLEGGGWSGLVQPAAPAGPAGPGLLQAAEEARRDHLALIFLQSLLWCRRCDVVLKVEGSG